MHVMGVLPFPPFMNLHSSLVFRTHADPEKGQGDLQGSPGFFLIHWETLKISRTLDSCPEKTGLMGPEDLAGWSFELLVSFEIPWVALM